MQQIINFIIRYKTFLLYFFLMVVSLGFTIQSHSYHQSIFFNSSNWVTGNVYDIAYGITSYFDLDEENERLLKENRMLRDLWLNQPLLDSIQRDTSALNYTIISGQVIKNSYADQRNYITLNKGRKDGVDQDMGVITDLGILGIVENTSNSFATVQSILNENSNINAKIKNTDHFGSLIWDTRTYSEVQLIDIPRLVPLTIGDTIVTGAMSSIFPENIPIGIIKQFDLDSSKSFYRINIDLFNDMTNIKNVYIINNLNKKEQLELQEATINE